MKTNILLLLILYSASAHGLAMTEVPLQSEQQAIVEQKSGWYDLVGKAVASFKLGYGYSEKEKKEAVIKEQLARIKIAELEVEKRNITDEYQNSLSNAISEHHKELLTIDYKEKIADLDQQIHEQKIITGEAMSFRRKLILGGVGVTAAVIGGAVIYQWFSKKSGVESMLVKEEKPRFVKRPDTQNVPAKIVQQKIEQQQETPKKEHIKERFKPEILPPVERKEVVQLNDQTVEQKKELTEQEHKQESIQNQRVQEVIEEQKNVEQEQQKKPQQKPVEDNERSSLQPSVDLALAELAYAEKIKSDDERKWGKSSGTTFKYRPFKLPPKITISIDQDPKSGEKLIQSLESRLQLIKAQEMSPGYKKGEEIRAQQDIENVKEWLKELQEWKSVERLEQEEKEKVILPAGEVWQAIKNLPSAVYNKVIGS